MTRALLLLTVSYLASGQRAGDDVDRFEVASILTTASDPRAPAIDFTPGGGLRATKVTLNLLIEMAYQIRSDQLSGGPRWSDSLEFAIAAKGPAHSEAAAPEVVRRRLQALLADRFHLSLARNSKIKSGFALVLANGGHKMVESTSAQLFRQTGMAGAKAQGVGMDLLARFLAVRVQEDVVDRTGLTGRYDFTLRWKLRPGQSVGNIPVPDTASLFIALQDQLGLKLERSKVAAESFVIERAEKPTEN